VLHQRALVVVVGVGRRRDRVLDRVEALLERRPTAIEEADPRLRPTPTTTTSAR